MSNQSYDIQKSDEGLAEWFKYFDNIPPKDKTTFDWSDTIDFEVFSEFLVNDIKNIKERLKSADDKYLYDTCEHLFNILDWIHLMVYDAGFPSFIPAWENVFDKEFGDKQILPNMFEQCFERWLSQKKGQQKIGMNFYNIVQDKLYYRNRFRQWFEVEKKSAFDLKPNKKIIDDEALITQLNQEYQETWYDKIIKTWIDKQYRGTLPQNFSQFKSETTTPEEYFDFTLTQINALLKDPISITELERWLGEEIDDLEDMIKITALVKDIVDKRRKDNTHTIYLLRDCIMFYEIQKTIDILEGQNTSVDQIMVGRKLLSHPLKEWGYYVGPLDALYHAHKRYPTNFEDFYNEYARIVDMFFSLNPGFATAIKNLAEYIKKHIHTNKEKIIIFDIGFQGSIALLTKYIIDRHILPDETHDEKATDIQVGVGAVWSKELFGNRHDGYYFPFLNRVQLAVRSNELYQYKNGSINEGKVEIVMADKKIQDKATIELVIEVMVTLISHKT